MRNALLLDTCTFLWIVVGWTDAGSPTFRIRLRNLQGFKNLEGFAKNL